MAAGSTAKSFSASATRRRRGTVGRRAPWGSRAPADGRGRQWERNVRRLWRPGYRLPLRRFQLSAASCFATATPTLPRMTDPRPSITQLARRPRRGRRRRSPGSTTRGPQRRRRYTRRFAALRLPAAWGRRWARREPRPCPRRSARPSTCPMYTLQLRGEVQGDGHGPSAHVARHDEQHCFEHSPRRHLLQGQGQRRRPI